MKRKKASYSISVVSEMFGVHQQTIRLYEKEGLIKPTRSEGNTRKFTEEDVEALEEVIRLTHKLGVNLSGVNIILKLQRQIDRMQKEMTEAFKQTQEQLEADSQKLKSAASASVSQLMNIKRSNAIAQKPEAETTEEFEEIEIDYNEE